MDILLSILIFAVILVLLPPALTVLAGVVAFVLGLLAAAVIGVCMLCLIIRNWWEER